MITLSPALLVASATSFLGLGEDGGDNRGQMVELFLRQVHQEPGQPWCAAFVYHVGFWSHYDHRSKRSSWPLPATASCAFLGNWAHERGVLRKEPALGDVFLLYNKSLGRFAHTGIVVAVHDRDPQEDRDVQLCTTVEGNTNDDGSRNGNMTLRKVRRFTERDRFVRWVDLDGRQRAAA